MSRSIGRAAAALVVVVLGLGPAPAATARPATPIQADARTSPALDVVDQTTWVEADGTFALYLDVRRATPGATVEATMYNDKVEDRAAFNRTLFGQALGDHPVPLQPVELDTVAPNAAGARRTIIVIGLRTQGSGPGHLSLSKGLNPGVYPIDVRMVAADGSLQKRIITHLVRLPDADDEIEPLRAALVLGVHAAPSIGPDGKGSLPDSTVRRLGIEGDVLESHPRVPITLAPTPETIEALQRDDERGRAIVSQYAAAARRGQVVDSPYVDIPLSAWLRAGMTDEIARQRQRGDQILINELDATPDPVTWVAGRDLDDAAVSWIWSVGGRRLVLPAGSTPDLPTSEEEPTAARPFAVKARGLAAPVEAVAADGSLSAAFGRAAGPGADPQLTAAQIVSELSVIQEEAPHRARGVVLVPAVDKPVSTVLLGELLDDLEGNPLVKAVTVDGLFDAVAAAREGGDGPVTTRSLTPAASPDLDGYPGRIAALHQRVASFTGLVGPANPLIRGWEQRLLLSGASDLSSSARNRYLSTIESTITAQTAAIDSPASQTVTLTSREGDVPFTVRSSLKQPVKVLLSLESSSRLAIPKAQIPITIEPGTRQVMLRVRARTSGDSPLTVRVTSPDGGLLLSTSRVTVRSTAVSGLGFVLSAGAAGFLVVWWFRHWRRARRQKREAHVTTSLVGGS